MEALLALALIAGTPEGTAEPLRVVVHSMDAKRTVFVCENIRRGRFDALQTGETFEPGRVNWRALGGQPPYRLVDDVRDPAGNVCITVMDATGAIATGCGMLLTYTEVVQVNCPVIPDVLEPVAFITKAGSADDGHRESDGTTKPQRDRDRQLRHTDRGAREPGVGMVDRPALNGSYTVRERGTSSGGGTGPGPVDRTRQLATPR
jgi:hypothetical protein